MDRVIFRGKFSKKIESFRIDGLDEDVYLKQLSALERACLLDTYQLLSKDGDSDNRYQKATIEAQCFIVSKGLVDKDGRRLYGDDEAEKMAEEIPCLILDQLSQKILSISGMGTDQKVDITKNSPPAPSNDSNTALP